MSIKQCTEPCWVLYLTNDDEVHCGTAEQANNWLTPDEAHMHVRVERADQGCWTARCNTCGETENDENGDTVHFRTAEEFEDGDLTTNPDGTHTCEWCRRKCPCVRYTTHPQHGDPWCTCSHQHARHTNTGDCTIRIESADALFDLPAAGGVLAGAQISTCGTYRYTLDRVWDASLPTAVFIMLNPSTASATEDDPTIRRCVGFAKREGCGGLTVINLYALRATNPAELRTHSAPIGARNSMWTCAVLCKDPSLVIVAWGADPMARDQASFAAHTIAAHGLHAMCLGTTKDGSPRHPLYVRADQPLQAWTPTTH